MNVEWNVKLQSPGKKNKSSAVAEIGDCLATIDMGRKAGGGLLCPFLEGELGTHLTQCRLDRGLPPFWSIQPFDHSMPTSQADRTDRTDNGPTA